VTLLEGLRVLEVGEGTAAAFCGRVLADLGAEVVMTEPPDGHPRRVDEPRRDGVSGRFAYLSAGKRRQVVGDDGELAELVAASDALITDLEPSRVDRIVASPRVVVVAIRPYGATGPNASHRAHHLTVFHGSGEGSTLPSGRGFEQFPDRPPVQLGSDIAYFDAGWNGAIALLAASYDLRRSGTAEHVDVSIQESVLTLNRTRMNRYNNEGVNHGREGSRYGITGMLRCVDGWAQVVGLREEHWDRLVALPEGSDFRDAGFETRDARAADTARLGTVLAAWCAARTKAEVVEIVSGIGAPAGAFTEPQDLLASGQLAHRRFFRTVDDGAGGTVRVPGMPFNMTAAPAGSAPVRAPAGRMLEGVRVLDFTWAAAGPYATLLLGFLGAEVIKVESTRRLDPARSGFLSRYEGVDASPIFNELSLNKRSLQVDLTQPEGIALVQRLVTDVDVVVDNFRPGVMARFGLGPADLFDRNPRLVVASSSANGATGPEAMGAGLASIFAATGGLSEQTGYVDGPPTEVGDPVDYRSGAALGVGILAALLHAARTGRGHYVDMSSREVVIASAPDALLAHVLGVPWQPRIGNAHRTMAPHGVYPCRDGEWVAVAVGDAGERAALARVLGVDSTEPDDAVPGWTCTKTAVAAAAELQAAGVPASPVMTFAALAGDPHLAARGTFVDVAHPVLGQQRVMRAPWLFSSWGNGVRGPGPVMGADNDAVIAGGLVTLDPDRAAEVFR